MASGGLGTLYVNTLITNSKTNGTVDIEKLKDGIVSILYCLLYFRMK